MNRIVLTMVVLSSACVVRGEDWPQFRGPNCSGISKSKRALPVEFSDTENVRWSVDLGDGIGCPVVAGGRVFASSMLNDHTVALHAYDSRSGRRLWTQKWETGPLPEIHKTNSHASTTPAADAKRVYFYFSSLGLFALDAKTGEQAWHLKLPVPFYVFKWGPAMSPVLYKDKVLFCQDDDLYPALYAIDKSTGAIVWKDERYDMAVNYSHPIVCRNDGSEQIVVAGTGKLIGYDPETGKRLWYAKSLLRNIKTTPVTRDGTIYLSLQSGGIANQWLATADQSETGNKDGKLSKKEMQAFVGETKIPDAFFRRTFDRGDSNNDGFLEGEELDEAFLHPDNFAGARFDSEDPADEYIVAVRGGGSGDVTGSHVLWRHRTKYTDHIVSPLVVDNRLLLVKGNGVSTCFGTKDGAQLRAPKRIGDGGGCFASPIYGDGKIYVAMATGNVLVLENSAEVNLLANNDMGDAILGTPAISGGNIYVRTRSKLVCVGNSE